MTSRSSRQGANESKVFFIVLMATYRIERIKLEYSEHTVRTVACLLTIVPLLAMFEPAVLTRATATLPKLPSPISLRTSNRSSRVAVDAGAALREECSYETVMVPVSG